MILLQVTNPIFVLKDEFYSLTCVVHQLKGVCKKRIMKRIIQMWHLTNTSSKSFEYFNYLQCFAIAGRDNVNLKCSLLPTLQRKQIYFENKHVAVSTHIAARWTETSIYYFINSSHHSSSYLHSHTKTKFTINHFKYYSFNLNHCK